MTEIITSVPAGVQTVHVASFSTVDASADWSQTIPLSIPAGSPAQPYILQVENKGFPSWPFHMWASEPDSAGNPIDIEAPLPPSPGTIGQQCTLAGGWSANIHLDVTNGGQPVPPGATLTLMLLMLVGPSA